MLRYRFNFNFNFFEITEMLFPTLFISFNFICNDCDLTDSALYSLVTYINSIDTDMENRLWVETRKFFVCLNLF